jgi:hypothetical protein
VPRSSHSPKVPEQPRNSSPFLAARSEELRTSRSAPAFIEAAALCIRDF